MKRWAEGGSAPEHADVADVVRRAAEVKPAASSFKSWDEILFRASQPRIDWRLLPAFGASLLVGGLLVLVLHRPAELPVTQRPTDELRAAPSAVWRRTTPRRVVLTRGAVAFAPQRELEVEAGAVTLVSSQSRFLAEVVEGTTLLLVESGEVEVRTPSGSERLTGPARRAWNSHLAPEANNQHCTQVTGAERLTCLKAEAAGAGLTAQAASYELGAALAALGDGQGAVAAWRSSLQRFANGVLAPEVRLALVSELAREGAFDEARAEARLFLAAWPEDPRSGEVQAFAERLRH